jgi:flagellar motility protein MotE (MotC chaperone)
MELCTKNSAMQNPNYDPMQDLYQKAIAFLFKQGVAIVICICFATVLWLKIGQMERQARLDRFEIRKECADSIAQIRDELRYCVAQKDSLIKENIALNRRVAALEARLKH